MPLVSGGMFCIQRYGLKVPGTFNEGFVFDGDRRRGGNQLQQFMTCCWVISTDVSEKLITKSVKHSMLKLNITFQQLRGDCSL